MENQVTESQIQAIRRANQRLGRPFDRKEVAALSHTAATESITTLHREVDDITYHASGVIEDLHIARLMARDNGENVSWADSSAQTAGKSVSEVRDLVEGIHRDAHEQMENGTRERVEASEAQVDAIKRCERMFPSAVALSGLEPHDGEELTKPQASLRIAILDRYGAKVRGGQNRGGQNRGRGQGRGKGQEQGQEQGSAGDTAFDR